MERFDVVAAELGFTERVRSAINSQVVARLLIQTGRPLAELAPADFDELAAACRQREQRTGAGWRHYSSAMFTARHVLFHMGVLADPPPNPSAALRQSFERRMADVTDSLRPSFVAIWTA